MAKFDIKTVKPKFVVTTSPENKIDVVVNKPIIETKLSKSFFKLKNTGGPVGPRGPQGERGEQGLPGERGPEGLPGRDGRDGVDGQDGQAATIEVASTSTLPAGSSATVSNVGSTSQARLAFGIPKGDKGDTGAAGADGDAATITVGQVETLQPNQPAYVQNVGTTSAAIFNIGIPKGDKGDSGSGSGDMTASTYDPNGTVASAGGIPDYVSSQLPTVNDATLTIQKNGTTVQTFTANQGSNATANITVPTDTGDLTNGAGFITSSALPTVNDGTLTIQHNGTTVETFTANASSNVTANIETIYADTVSPITTVASIGTTSIQDGAVTSAKIDSGTYSITDTPAHSGGTNSYIVSRIANIIIVNISSIWAEGSAMAANTWFSIGQLPSSIHPANNITTTAYTVRGDDGNYIATSPAQITTSGVIRIKPPTVQSILTGVNVLFVYTI